ncbi:MAG: Panacea domain-containing protein [Brevundimonas sp.]|uniref:Panacea domain-containing protein n=1 Tax=Brevundimonas sp. TaxID=1871086 RepID=UPI00271B4FFE|nr:Panacea domain-containing protein [Brevundimonas sp.]MDO9586768.1 Panacea domain-containing protein [Brevundimonas sp.]MDP3657256.1 Panacea domain-containing protein [Brevundimonas sp.]
MFDREKFKRLVHYVIAQAGSHPGFGATKLNKVLWFADARQWTLTGKSITGATYVRQQFGPVPQQIMPVRSELEGEGAIKCYSSKSDYEGWRFKSLRPAPATAFSADELQLVRHWIKIIDEDHTAETISELSHDYGWEIAAMGETLPFHAVLAGRRRAPTDQELAWGRDVAARVGAA